MPRLNFRNLVDVMNAEGAGLRARGPILTFLLL